MTWIIYFICYFALEFVSLIFILSSNCIMCTKYLTFRKNVYDSHFAYYFSVLFLFNFYIPNTYEYIYSWNSGWWKKKNWCLQIEFPIWGYVLSKQKKEYSSKLFPISNELKSHKKLQSHFLYSIDFIISFYCSKLRANCECVKESKYNDCLQFKFIRIRIYWQSEK